MSGLEPPTCPLRAISACRAVVWPGLRNSEARTRTTDTEPSYYHLRYHLWMGVRRDSSGTNSTTTEQKALRRDQTGLDGT
jgi:hypothetical protein